jgi:hypothetical protein
LRFFVTVLLEPATPAPPFPKGRSGGIIRQGKSEAKLRGFESRPYRREPTTRGAKRKTSPSYSVNMRGFFRLSCLGLKPRKRQKTTKHLT